MDYAIFTAVSLTVVGLLHVGLRRMRRVGRAPIILWALAVIVLIPGYWALNSTGAVDGRVDWSRSGAIGMLTGLEAALIALGTLALLFQVESRRRRRAQLLLAAYRHRIERQVKARSEELLAAQRQMMQSEKLASLGQLAAGVAHEINTPIQYVGDNLRAISDFMGDLMSLNEQYHALVEMVKSSGASGDLVERIERAERESDIEFIREDAPKAVEQGLEGVRRVAHIVRAMKDFSHVNRDEAGLVNVNRALENTLTVARNEYKYVAEMETEFGELPEIEAFGGELNQVFLNLVVNAAHAIADTGRHGTIGIRTRSLDDQIEVAISDTGTGIPKAVQHKIFDPFFTTKPVGKGTGQGLNITHQIIHKHGGSVRFETEEGKGTTFIIRLPVKMGNIHDASGEAGVQQEGSGKLIASDHSSS